MKSIFTFCIYLLLLTPVFAQNQTDSVVFETNVGTVILQNNNILSPKQLLYVMEQNTEAYNEMSLAVSCRNSGMFLGFGGAFAVGWTIGRLIAGGDPNWILAGAGVGCIGGSITLHSMYVHHARNAVSIYNEGLKQTGLTIPKLKLKMEGNGIGICLLF